MMRLSTLWMVERLVDSVGRNHVADQILANWEHDDDSLRFVRSSANFVCRFTHDGERRFLRFAASSERERDAIAAEVHLLTWLTRVGLPVNHPIVAKTGRFVETVETDAGTFHAVVFAGLPGSHLAFGDLTLSQFRAWGAALGQLHLAMKKYPQRHALSRSSWREYLEPTRRLGERGEPAVARELDRVTAALEALPVNPDSYGLIHFDFELDNLCWQDGSIGILDFDHCAHCWYVADIAFALRDLFVDDVDLNAEPFRAFVGGYAEQCPLDRELLATIPLFLRALALIHYAWLTRSLDLPDNPKYPDWLEGLRRKFATRLATYRSSLAE